MDNGMAQVTLAVGPRTSPNEVWLLRHPGPSTDDHTDWRPPVQAPCFGQRRAEFCLRRCSL